MTLAEAMESIERALVGMQHVDREALRLVFVKAEENLAAETVVKVNALSARALEASRPHSFRPDRGPRRSLGCMLCGEHEFADVHLEPGATP